jgi:hypothetical protein
VLQSGGGRPAISRRRVIPARVAAADYERAATSSVRSGAMATERFLNAYHNASTAPSPDVPEDLASFMLAADPVHAEAADLARVLSELIKERPRS